MKNKIKLISFLSFKMKYIYDIDAMGFDDFYLYESSLYLLYEALSKEDRKSITDQNLDDMDHNDMDVVYNALIKVIDEIRHEVE